MPQHRPEPWPAELDGGRPLFVDRADAGRRLATALSPLRGSDVVVLALPRGGVPVAAPVAAALNAPLDVFVVRKIGAPDNPEAGIGALAEDDEPLIDPRATSIFGIAPDDIAAVVAHERAELRRRVRAYRGSRAPLSLEHRTVVVVDDGVATGGTLRAAVRALRRRRPARIIAAAPVASAEAVEVLEGMADDVVMLAVRTWLRSVGEWYVDFTQTTDAEVVQALERAQERAS